MIIICHIFQYLGVELAWWFNVGVQIFLCISGFLYGQKNIGDISSFYNRRFRKILTPFFIVLIPALAINLIRSNITFSTALRAILLNTTFSGAGHLWFVPTILFCYVITPIMQSFNKDVSKRQWIITTVFSVEIAALFSFGFTDFYNGAWIGCYILGYAIGQNEKQKYLSQKILIRIYGLLSMLNMIQIFVDYIGKYQFGGTIGKIYEVFKMYNHVWLGIFLFLALKSVLNKKNFPTVIINFLDISDKYSYETYLVHQFLILGPFSLMELTPILPLNIVIILIGIGVLAWLLKMVEMPIMERLSRIESTTAKAN